MKIAFLKILEDQKNWNRYGNHQETTNYGNNNNFNNYNQNNNQNIRDNNRIKNITEININGNGDGNNFNYQQNQNNVFMENNNDIKQNYVFSNNMNNNINNNNLIFMNNNINNINNNYMNNNINNNCMNNNINNNCMNNNINNNFMNFNINNINNNCMNNNINNNCMNNNINNNAVKIKKNFVDKYHQNENYDSGISGGVQKNNSYMFKNSSISDFEKLGDLGSGSFGVVEKMRFKKDGNTYAVKEISYQNYTDRKQKQLKREIELPPQFLHDNIVKFYGSFNENNKIYLVSEFIDGLNLEEYIINQKGQLDENTILLITKHMASGLQYLHNLNLMHRDIKPDNILLILENSKIINVKISDFGEAALYKKDKNYNFLENEFLFSEMTQAGRIDYAAPEIKKGQKNYTLSVDIYSFGLVLTQMMFPCKTKEIIKNGKTVVKLVTVKAREDDFNRNLYSNELIKLVLNMIDDESTKRPSAKQIYDEIENMINLRKHKNSIENVSISSLNCVCHILYNIQEIKAYIYERLNSKNIINKDKVFVAYNLRDLFIKLHKAKKKSENYKTFYDKDLKDFRTNISQKINLFNIYKEVNPVEIINEFFETFLYELKVVDGDKWKNNLFINILNKSNEINSFPRRNYSNLYKIINNFINNYRNIFVDIFYFLELINLYECSHCKKIDFDPQVRFYLSFKINTKELNISQLFSEYIKSPHNIIMTCQHCQKPNLTKDIIVQNKMLCLPKILIIQLENAEPGQTIDEEIININQYVITDLRPNSYKLFAVISKTIKKGDNFYIAYIKKDDNWISINDEGYKKCSYEDVNREKPIIVIYKGY